MRLLVPECSGVARTERTEATHAASSTPSPRTPCTPTPTPRPALRSSWNLDATNKRRRKGESFNQKEKRKRDLGQASRGKSFVEEEKRILRQFRGATGES